MTFVQMPVRLSGTGTAGNLNPRNNQIRAAVQADGGGSRAAAPLVGAHSLGSCASSARAVSATFDLGYVSMTRW